MSLLTGNKSKPHFNADTPEWRSKVEFLKKRRADLYEELCALPREGERDRSDFIRGRIHELSELIDLKTE